MEIEGEVFDLNEALRSLEYEGDDEDCDDNVTGRLSRFGCFISNVNGDLRKSKKGEVLLEKLYQYEESLFKKAK